MGKIVNLSERTNSSRYISPEDMLELALRDLKSQDLHGEQAILLVLDRGPDRNCYSVAFRSANMQKSEIVALLTVQAIEFAKDLKGA